jgi:hypothetical protein
MYELGKKDEIFGAELLRPLRVYGRPDSMPILVGDDMVICGFDQGLGERMIVCETLEDMQSLWDQYAQGYALNIYWYLGSDPGFLTLVSPESEDQAT